MSEVRGSGRECQAVMAQEQPRGVTPCPRSGRLEEPPHARGQGQGQGQEEQPHARGQGQRPGGATPCPRSGGYVDAGGPRGAIPC